jgi:hypothetical protein
VNRQGERELAILRLHIPSVFFDICLPLSLAIHVIVSASSEPGLRLSRPQPGDDKLAGGNPVETESFQTIESVSAPEPEPEMPSPLIPTIGASEGGGPLFPAPPQKKNPQPIKLPPGAREIRPPPSIDIGLVAGARIGTRVDFVNGADTAFGHELLSVVGNARGLALALAGSGISPFDCKSVAILGPNFDDREVVFACDPRDDRRDDIDNAVEQTSEVDQSSGHWEPHPIRHSNWPHGDRTDRVILNVDKYYIIGPAQQLQPLIDADTGLSAKLRKLLTPDGESGASILKLTATRIHLLPDGCHETSSTYDVRISKATVSIIVVWTYPSEDAARADAQCLKNDRMLRMLGFQIPELPSKNWIRGAASLRNEQQQGALVDAVTLFVGTLDPPTALRDARRFRAHQMARRAHVESLRQDFDAGTTSQSSVDSGALIMVGDAGLRSYPSLDSGVPGVVGTSEAGTPDSMR